MIDDLLPSPFFISPDAVQVLMNCGHDMEIFGFHRQPEIAH